MCTISNCLNLLSTRKWRYHKDNALQAAAHCHYRTKQFNLSQCFTWQVKRENVVFWTLVNLLDPCVKKVPVQVPRCTTVIPGNGTGCQYWQYGKRRFYWVHLADHAVCQRNTRGTDSCPPDSCPPDSCPPDSCPLDSCPPSKWKVGHLPTKIVINT